MVVSKLSKNINYTEKMRLDSEDVDHNATSYNANILGFELLIAIGKEKYGFVGKNVIYFPIYLIKDDKVFNQIGVYEIYSHTLPNILDVDGDVDLDELSTPLLYSFVDDAYLKKFEGSYDSDEEESNSDEEDSDDETNETEKKETEAKDDTEKKETEKKETEKKETEAKDDTDKKSKITERFIINKDALTLSKEDAEEKEEEKKKVEEEDEEIADTGLWIQKYMKDSKYDIVDTAINGDCFFDSVRIALEQRSGESTTIRKLRKMVSDELTDDIFENYKINYTMITESIKENDSQMKKINSLNRKYKKELNLEKDRTKQLEIIENGKTNSVKFKEYKKENEMSKDLLQDFIFMKNIVNTQQFKDYILKSEYYADTWAISTLERVLNMKLVILSYENYIYGDLHNIILCGQLNDKVEKLGSSSPKYYIIVQFEGLHYKLITYNSKTTFSFKDLPIKLTNKIYDKCCENSRGPFGQIEDFYKLKKEDDDNQDVDINSIEINANLFDEDIIFQYYIKSSNKPIPGKGPGETISLNKIKDYGKLQSILNWRKQLSNLYEKEFELDEKKWLTIEHFMNANKFKNNKDIYDNLSLNSKSEISSDIYKMQEEVKGLTKDINYDKKRDDILKRAIKAKFSQNEELENMLKETNRAKLVNYIVKREPITSFELMRYRKTLLNT